AIQRNTFDLMQTLLDVHPLDMAQFRSDADQLPALVKQTESEILNQFSAVPDVPGAKARSDALTRYQQGSAQRQTEAEKVKTDLLVLLDSAEGKQAFDFLQQGDV